MFELFVDGEIIKFIHVLQKPQIIVKSGVLLRLFHHFAHVQELQVNDMHIDVFAFVLLKTELRLFEWRLKDSLSVILYRIMRHYRYSFLLFVLIFELTSFVVKILPNHISRFFLISVLQTLSAFYDS